MIQFIKAGASDLDLCMTIRLEMLLEVNSLPAGYKYNESFIKDTRKYFEHGDQTSVLALDGKNPVGCASISYISIMPTFSHPTGKRAHLMNVYVNSNYRRQGIAKKLVSMLIKEARERGCTEISLDATDKGRPVYDTLGFTANDSAMNLNLH